jgi:RNA polymerase sigma factor (sigma-70 family)
LDFTPREISAGLADQGLWMQLLARCYADIWHTLAYHTLEPRWVVDDVMQEAFIKMARGRQKFDLCSSEQMFRLFLAVAKNAHIDYRRREDGTKGQRRHVSIEDVFDDPTTHPSRDPVSEWADFNAVIEALASLPPGQAQILLDPPEQMGNAEYAKRWRAKRHLAKLLDAA